MATGNNFFEIHRQFGNTRPQKGPPALHYSIEVENEWNYPSTPSPSGMPSRSAQGNVTYIINLSNHKFEILNKLYVHCYNIGLWSIGTDSFVFLIVWICNTPYLNHLSWWTKTLNSDHQQSTGRISVFKTLIVNRYCLPMQQYLVCLPNRSTHCSLWHRKRISVYITESNPVITISVYTTTRLLRQILWEPINFSSLTVTLHYYFRTTFVYDTKYSVPFIRIVQILLLRCLSEKFKRKLYTSFRATGLQ